LKNLVQYFRDNGEYISAAQFQGNNDYDIPITIAYTNEPKIESEQIIEKVNQISEKDRERENSWYQRILDFISSGNSSRKTPYIPKDMISKMEDKCKELKVFYTIDRKGDQTAFIFSKEEPKPKQVVNQTEQITQDEIDTENNQDEIDTENNQDEIKIVSNTPQKQKKRKKKAKKKD